MNSIIIIIVIGSVIVLIALFYNYYLTKPDKKFLEL